MGEVQALKKGGGDLAGTHPGTEGEEKEPHPDR